MMPIKPKKHQSAPSVQKTVSPKPRPVRTLAPGYERLERAIAHRGLASRREAKDLITRGLVSVNGMVVTEPGFGIVVAKDTILIKNSDRGTKESFLVYKSRGIETSKTSPHARDLHDQFPKLAALSPIGRLDKDSEGLIIMSNDGTLTKALTAPASSIGKKYLVTVRENIPDTSLFKMSRGIVLDRVMTKPANVKRVSRTAFLITLYEGRKHQIRRMCDACHLTIVSLVRVGIGHLDIAAMKPGTIKKLTASDITLLKQ